MVVVRLISSSEPEVNKQSLGWMEALINWKARFDSSEVDLFQRAWGEQTVTGLDGGSKNRLEGKVRQ